MTYTKVGELADFPDGSHRVVRAGALKVVVFHYDGTFSAIANACLHKAGPLGLGRVERKYDGWYVTCPWHGWEYNIRTGGAPPGYHDQQAVHDVVLQGTDVLVSTSPATKARPARHDLSVIDDLVKLKYQTTPDSLHVLGISTTAMNDKLARFSTSESALEDALAFARERHGAATRLLRLRDLGFRHCEGYYSQHMNACTWPCSITEMQPDDGMTEVYRAMVLWADIVVLGTPIRWGNASSLYFKMAERLNCVQNQVTVKDRLLIRNKVAAFIITGGQDNVQQVAAQMMVFFTDLGFTFPPFSFVGWSRGWTAEDMDKNILQFKRSGYMARSVHELVDNAVLTLRHIKQMPMDALKAPKPHAQDSLSADLENPDMNV